ncbi:MAG: class I SAM-dependent methyltransferase [Candidatus Rokubacteria bacterium]|nr:class I SAM-dependent methyltransferase [Candidatus Rokubacteria bacterium]MBI4271792.1 class I SAM-dependent methyltransferase [Candidatus Rokubacteria bacterium]
MSDTQTRRVQEQFGASAQAYVQSAGHAGGPDLEQLVAWGRARAPARVLDVATGAGHTALAFATLAARVVAFDVTEPMLRVAAGFIGGRGARNVAYVAGAVEALPFGDGAFDLVTCRIAAHHFADVPAAVRQVQRVLRPGGTFLLQDILGHDDSDANAFITEIEKRRDPSHVRAYRASEWKAFLRAAGLTVLEQTVIEKARPWEEWTRRTRMTPGARRDLDAFVRQAPQRCRDAFVFTLAGETIESFADRMLLLRADRD